MPETRKLPVVAGIEFYNYPKFLASVDFREERDERIRRLAEGKEHILTLHGRVIPAAKTAMVRQFSHLWMDGQPQTSEIKIHKRQVGRTLSREAATVELGNHHPIARELDRLLVSRRALVYEYVPSQESILFFPEHLTPALLVSTVEAIERGRQLAAHH